MNAVFLHRSPSAPAQPPPRSRSLLVAAEPPGPHALSMLLAPEARSASTLRPLWVARAESAIRLIATPSPCCSRRKRDPPDCHALSMVLAAEARSACTPRSLHVARGGSAIRRLAVGQPSSACHCTLTRITRLTGIASLSAFSHPLGSPRPHTRQRRLPEPFLPRPHSLSRLSSHPRRNHRSIGTIPADRRNSPYR